MLKKFLKTWNTISMIKMQYLDDWLKSEVLLWFTALNDRGAGLDDSNSVTHSEPI